MQLSLSHPLSAMLCRCTSYLWETLNREEVQPDCLFSDLRIVTQQFCRSFVTALTLAVYLSYNFTISSWQEMGRFPFNKNSGLKFLKFHVPNGAVHSGCTDTPDASHRAFGCCSCKLDTKKRFWGQHFCRMERDISVRPTEMTRPVKEDHLQSWSWIYPSDQTEMIRSIWCTNRNFFFLHFFMFSHRISVLLRLRQDFVISNLVR